MLTLTIWFCLLFFHNLPINNFSSLLLAFHKIERCMSHPFYPHRSVSYHHLTSLTSYFSKKNNKIIKIFFWRIKNILKAKLISLPFFNFVLMLPKDLSKNFPSDICVGSQNRKKIHCKQLSNRIKTPVCMCNHKVKWSSLRWNNKDKKISTFNTKSEKQLEFFT